MDQILHVRFYVHAPIDAHRFFSILCISQAGAAVGGHPNTDFLPAGCGGGGNAVARYASNKSNFGGGEGHQQIHNYNDAPTRTVYKKAPGAPKRFKSSYVHFFTHFIDQKKQELGPDGEVRLCHQWLGKIVICNYSHRFDFSLLLVLSAHKNGCSCRVEGMLSDMEIYAARTETILGQSIGHGKTELLRAKSSLSRPMENCNKESEEDGMMSLCISISIVWLFFRIIWIISNTNFCCVCFAESGCTETISIGIFLICECKSSSSQRKVPR